MKQIDRDIVEFASGNFLLNDNPEYDSLETKFVPRLFMNDPKSRNTKIESIKMDSDASLELSPIEIGILPTYVETEKLGRLLRTNKNLWKDEVVVNLKKEREVIKLSMFMNA